MRSEKYIVGLLMVGAEGNEVIQMMEKSAVLIYWWWESEVTQNTVSLPMRAKPSVCVCWVA
jgi:hypothetical protein